MEYYDSAVNVAFPDCTHYFDQCSRIIHCIRDDIGMVRFWIVDCHTLSNECIVSHLLDFKNHPRSLS